MTPRAKAKMDDENVNICECECGCHDVALIVKHQPEVKTFQEYARLHTDILDMTLDIVEEMLDRAMRWQREQAEQKEQKELEENG